MIFDRRAIVLFVAGWVGLLATGFILGALWATVQSERDVATCHGLRAEAFQATLQSKLALEKCTCAVTGQCRR